MSSPTLPLVIVDIGNTRLKFGLFDPHFSEPLPHPNGVLSVRPDWNSAELKAFLPGPAQNFRWAIASVNRPAAAQLTEWLATQGVTPAQLKAADLPLQVDVEFPERVGLDRLANVVAVNRLRRAGEPAIIIDLGTALKVDYVSAAGAFAGGSIMLGLATTARALHEFTDLLPLVEVSEPPPALGKSTTGAIQSGLYWGAIGAVKELVAQLSGDRDTEIFLTGGAGPLFANVLSTESVRPPIFVPHLTLAGVALAAAAVLPAEPTR